MSIQLGADQALCLALRSLDQAANDLEHQARLLRTQAADIRRAAFEFNALESSKRLENGEEGI